MQNVSAQFLAALVAPERQVKARMNISLFDNDQLLVGGGVTVSSNSELRTPPVSFPAEVLNDVPFGYWRLTEPSGSVAADSTAYAHNGSYIGTMTLGQTGPLSGGRTAPLFDGSTAYVDTPNTPSSSVVTPSVELWFRVPTAPTGGTNFYLLDKTASNVINYALNMNSSGQIRFQISNGTTTATVTSISGYADNGWHHVVAVRDTSLLRLYIDGSQVATASDTVTGSIQNTNQVNIGRRCAGDSYTHGYIAEVAIYGYTLSASRVAFHYGQRTATSDDTTPFGPASAAFDGRSVIGYDAAVLAADSTEFPSTILFPAQPSNAWWASIQSDASGNLNPAPWCVVNYGAIKTVQAMTVAGDTYLGYPVAFTIDRSNDGTNWTNVITVTNNTTVNFVTQLASSISTQYLRLTITRWSLPNRFPVIVEFSNGWTITTDDALQDRLMSVEIKRESFYESDASLPIGNYSAGTCTVVLDNHDGVFYQRNTSSPYYGYLKPNKKILIWFGLYVPTDPSADTNGFVWLQHGTFYTLHFQGSLSSPTVTVEAWDRVKRFQEDTYQGTQVLVNQTISQLMTTAAQGFGLTVADYSFDTTSDQLPYAYLDQKSYWQTFVDLATAETGYVDMNYNNQLRFRNRYFFWSTRLTASVTQGATSFPCTYVGGITVGNTFYVMDQNGHTDSYVATAVNTTTNTVTVASPGAVRAYAPTAAGIYPMVSKATPVMAFTPTNVLTDASDEFSIDKMHNQVRITVNPLSPAKDKTGVLTNSTVQWQYQDGFSLAPNGSTVVESVNGIPNITITDTFHPAQPVILYTNRHDPHPPGSISFQNKPVLVDATHISNVSVLAAPVTGHDSNGNPTVGTAITDPLLANPTQTASNPMDNTVNLIQKFWTDVNGNDLAQNYPYAWGGYLELHNASNTEYRILQVTIDGFGLQLQTTTDVVVNDRGLMALYGTKEYKLDSPFIVTTTQAYGVAGNLLATWKDPAATMTVQLPVRGLPHLEIGDRVTIQSTDMGLVDTALNNHYFVVRHSLKWDGGALDSEIDLLAAL